MKGTFLLKAILLVTIFNIFSFNSVAKSRPEWELKESYYPYDWLSTEITNDVYLFDICPPEGCDTVKAICVSNFWQSGAPEMKPRHRFLDILVNNDTQEVFIPFNLVSSGPAPFDYNIPSLYKTKYVATWIRGTLEGDKFVFKDKSRIGINSYDLSVSYEDYRATSDTIRLYGAEKGKHFDLIREFYIDEHNIIDHSTTGYEFNYTNQDVTFDFSRRPFLISNPRSAIYIGPYDSTDYFNGWVYLSKNEAFVNEMVIGILAPTAPEHLPVPEAKMILDWKSGEWYRHDIYIPGHTRATVKVNIDCVTEDGYVLDPSRLHANILADGKFIHYCKVDPFFNDTWPDFFDLNSWKKDYWFDFPKLEVKVWYESEDGTRVTSPLAEVDLKIYDRPSGIDEINADSDTENHSTFDLTGRRVNPDNLAPGIYIRDGRKFVVGRP